MAITVTPASPGSCEVRVIMHRVHDNDRSRDGANGGLHSGEAHRHPSPGICVQVVLAALCLGVRRRQTQMISGARHLRLKSYGLSADTLQEQ